MIKQLFTFFACGCFFFLWAGAYNLSITEVLVDGSDEFIEIANRGETLFSGSLSVSGAKTSLLTLPNISLAPGEVIVLGDTLSYLSSDFTGAKKSGLGLSFPDTETLDVSLWVDDLLIDTFFVSSGEVMASDNKKTSFERIGDGSSWSLGPTILDHIRGTAFIVNPGRVYGEDGSVSLPWTINSDPDTPGTGDESGGGTGDLPGTGSTDSSCPGIPFGMDELYNGSAYSHYIEILPTEDREGGLTISGDALISSVDIPSRTWEKHTRYLLTTSLSGILHGDENSEEIIIIPSLVIETGQVSITRPDGQLLLSSYVMETGSSWSEAGLIDCDHFFTLSNTPSPGFDKQFLPYMGVISTPPGPSCPLDGGNEDESGEEENPTTGDQTTTGIAELRLSLIDYDPPGSDTNTERIGLISLSGDIALSGWKLMYENKTYQFLSGVVLSGQEYIRTANFQMVNSRPVCVNLYYGDIHVDVACYDPNLHTSPYLPLVEPELPLNYADLQFSLLSLIYDPPGSDTNNESVTIRFDSGAESIDLKDFTLRVGNNNKKLSGTLTSGQTVTLVGNFQMPNTTPTCVALMYKEILYDEYCYTPSKELPTDSTPDYSSFLITIQELIYDPVGSDTDNEVVVLSLPYGTLIDLSTLYLRFDGKKRYLQGVTYGGSSRVQGNYQMPNSKKTCVDLMQGDHIFDTKCYDPAEKILSGSELSGTVEHILSGVIFHIDSLVYDPPGSDNGREVVTLTVSEPLVLSAPMYLGINGKKKKLSDVVSLSGTMTFIGNYQMPNTKATCVQLLYLSQILDEYCYDPQEKEIVLSGMIDTSIWSGLELNRVLPNPQGRDTINDNERIALGWKGTSRQILTHDIRLNIGKSSMSLSGIVVEAGETIISSSKTLPNTPQCLYLSVGDIILDHLCYPQAKEGTRYYHPRLNTGPSTIPDSLIDTLNFNQGNLSKLLLQKIEKKICLTYEGVQIRCLASGESSLSKKNRALLTLNNAYIARVTNLYYANQLHPQTLRQRLQSYTLLSQKIKQNNLASFSVYGAKLKPTELQRHVDLISNQSSDEYLLDEIGRSLFGHDKMDEYYHKIFQG